VLGLPLRLMLGVGGVAIPLLAVAVFSSSHDWPPPPSCAFAVFGCPSAPYPMAVQRVDWAYTAGPLIGIVLAIIAWRIRKEPGEGGVLGILMSRYAIPMFGLVVSVGCFIDLYSWMTHAGG
jgi:hypothetical protein